MSKVDGEQEDVGVPGAPDTRDNDKYAINAGHREVKLTRFRGHPSIREQGVHDDKDTFIRLDAASCRARVSEAR